MSESVASGKWSRVRSILPALAWLRTYDKSRLRGDLIAAITLAAYLLPAGLGGASLAIGIITLLLTATLPAHSAAPADPAPTTYWDRLQAKPAFERIWEASRLYDHPGNSVLQSFAIIGRYHGQYWSVNADQGDADGWANRRVYLGAEAVLFHDFTVHAQMKFSEDFDPVYNGLFQAYVRWQPAESFSVRVGKVEFDLAGLEKSLSSRKIVTFERGLLVNQLLPQEVVGAAAQDRCGEFSYQAGVFSGSVEKEFTSFAGGVGAAAGVGYELPLFYTSGTLHLDYLYNNGNPDNNAFKPYDHVVTLWHQGQSGPFGLGVDLTGAHGLDARPAVFGVTLLPTYVFAKDVLRKGDAVQAVLRYQFAISDGDNGLQLQPRYERAVVPSGFGDEYHAIYVGLNYLLYGDRFKLMTGAEYSVMRDSANDGGAFEGWTYLAGVRLYF